MSEQSIVAGQDWLPARNCQFPEKYGENSQDSSNSSDSYMDFVNLANLLDGSGGGGGVAKKGFIAKELPAVSFQPSENAQGRVVVNVVGVGMGLDDRYRLVIFANFCNFFKFCTGTLCNL